MAAGHDLQASQRESYSKNDHDYGHLVKDVDLKEFSKIVLRRRDLCKWIENRDFQESVKDAFVRVIYHRQYVIG